MALRIFERLLRKLPAGVCLCVFAAEAIAGEPSGLRYAIADHFRSEAERSNRLYGAHIEPAGRSSYQFEYALIDLNGDGIPDAVVLLEGDFCGSGGCTLEIYRGTSHGFKFVSAATLAHSPIRVLPQRRHGWKDLIYSSRYEGQVLLSFDGTRYRSSKSRVNRNEIDNARILTMARE